MPSATFDFATIYMWMAASCVFFAALRMSLERWVLPLVWDWIKCKESDRLPPEGYGAGTLQDISVRCTSVFFSTMIVANSYSVLMNPQMQHFAARGLLPGMTGEADWTAGCSWEATHCDAHFWSAAVVGGYMLYGAPADPPRPASALFPSTHAARAQTRHARHSQGARARTQRRCATSRPLCPSRLAPDPGPALRGSVSNPGPPHHRPGHRSARRTPQRLVLGRHGTRAQISREMRGTR